MMVASDVVCDMRFLGEANPDGHRPVKLHAAVFDDVVADLIIGCNLLGRDFPPGIGTLVLLNAAGAVFADHQAERDLLQQGRE